MTPTAPNTCPSCNEQLPISEPARTSLIVVCSFAAGVIAYGYMHERRDAQMVCVPAAYSHHHEAKE